MKNVNKLLTLLTFALLANMSLAQDGEALFKSKCNTCHMIDKNSTGPKLKGVKQKWEEAGEGELLYEWVMNPGKLYDSGKSTMATAIKDFSQTDMTPQQVSKDEIDAIFSYVENYSPAKPVDDPIISEATVVPDYKANLNIFYFLCAGIIIMLFVIIGMSGSIRVLVNSDYFKDKMRDSDSGAFMKSMLLLIGFTVLSSNQTFALSFMEPGEAAEDLPWLLVETTDLYYMLGVNIILLLVIFYLRRLFNEFMRMVKDEKEQPQEAPQEVLRKVNEVLTDAVPIEEEHKILLHHEYDGIQELDNNLPPWWLWGFYATIVFSVIYMINYHVLGISDLQAEEYEKSVKKAEIEVQAYLDKMAMNVDETNATLMTDSEDLSTGKVLFEKNCATCHKANGSGDIGPNLTDKYWIYGYDVKDVFKTIKHGTPNGMPSHSEKLNPIQTQQVASYLLSLDEIKTEKTDGEIIEK